jgi:hypothetical protein
MGQINFKIHHIKSGRRVPWYSTIYAISHASHVSQDTSSSVRARRIRTNHCVVDQPGARHMDFPLCLLSVLQRDPACGAPGEGKVDEFRGCLISGLNFSRHIGYLTPIRSIKYRIIIKLIV